MTKSPSVHKIANATFTPLVRSTTGEIGKATTIFYQLYGQHAISSYFIYTTPPTEVVEAVVLALC